MAYSTCGIFSVVLRTEILTKHGVYGDWGCVFGKWEERPFRA